MDSLVKMSRELVVDYFPLLQALTNVKEGSSKRKLLRQLAKDADFKRCLQEIAKNVTTGAVPLSAKDKKNLNRHSDVIRRLQRSESVSQSGGFLNIIVPLLATIVGELIANRK